MDTFTVSTDLLDYAPGSTSTITATGINAGDTVVFQVAHVDGLTSGDGHTPWAVTDGGEGDLDGIVNGVIVTSWYVNPDDSLGATFLLTAIDADATATAGFTDGPHVPVPAVPSQFITNGLVFLTGDTNTATGTGIFPSFVQIQNTGVEEGFNTNYRGTGSPVLDTDNSLVHNHNLLFGLVPVVTFNNTAYREFRLDLNDSPAAITLDSLKIYWASVGGLSTLASATELYNMDGGSDGKTGGSGADANVSVALTAWSSGSGHSDYKVLIPDSYFSTVDGTKFIYLYSEFSNANSGFEEWSVGPVSIVPANLTLDKKTQDLGAQPGTPDDGQTILTGEQIQWIYTLVNSGQPGSAVSGITLTDDQLGTLYTGGSLSNGVTLSGDSNGDKLLQYGETWVFTVTGTAGIGDYTNIATAEGTSVGGGEVADEDDSSYFGLNPHITLNKLTNGSDGPNLLQGQAITWTYDVKNDGNVDLSGVSVSDSPTQTITAILSGSYNSGDSDQDNVLDQGETWHFKATGTAGTTVYTNLATATTTAVADDAGHLVTPTATDRSSYTGHAQAQAGLTKGYWSTHLTEWDVITTDNAGKAELNPVPQYNWNGSGGITNSAVVTSGPASGKGAVSGTTNNGGGDSGLLMGDLNHDGKVTGESSDHLFFDLASAQILANSAVSGDARVILGSQAIASQLNEYAGWVLYGADTSPNGLINEAVQWLKGVGPLSNGGSKLNWSATNDVDPDGIGPLSLVQAIINDGTTPTNDYTISGSAITFKSAAISSSTVSWQTMGKVLDNSDYWNHSFDVFANGEGLKNALAAYNHGLSGGTGTQGFVVSTDGSLIGWQDSIGGTPYDVHANTADAFWGILADVGVVGVSLHTPV